ncbi:choline ABC transporter ATP-binding protein [Sulfitobacter pacificus]|uniref:Choline ABC transporter ATP-binding protein n=1 Tax=Sulfitobacter pacificus TaxID=1499314 RepID=A0ABQ5VGM9_9RHOB|nr:choline ABC transporter ATP-binding protein [Sulfitobacter pacificus]GLQ26242.1 choline ABC transporter ATP-binding protein [Sulfitobacter pacificus]
MSTAVKFDNVSIVFGEKPQAALELMDQGQNRPEIEAATGQVLGVHNCSLEVAEGEILVLMGLSGSGKSTLLRAVNGLNPVVRGHVEVNDGAWSANVQECSPSDLRKVRRECVSMVFQQFGLLPWRTVRDNVAMALEFSDIAKAERNARAEKQLALVGLSDWADRKVGDLSGGMQQRVGLARAFVTEAPILLMDEPFSALDPLIRTRLQDELLELQRDLKRTIIFVSHDLDEAFKLGGRIAIMEGGRIVQLGTPREIFSNPASDYVADFVSNMNPLGVLTARDVMEPASEVTAPQVAAETPVAELMQQLTGEIDALRVMDGDTVLGMVTAQSIVARLNA